MSNGDRKNGVPATVTSIPLVDPHAPKPDPSLGDLVKDATADYSDVEMHASLDVNIPNYASALVTTQEIVDTVLSL